MEEEGMTLALIYVRQSRHKDYERTVSPEVQEQQAAEQVHEALGLFG